MANSNTPYGLVPTKLHGAVDGNESARIYFVANTQTNALFIGDPVTVQSGVTSPTGIKGVDLSANTGAWTGVVVGFQGSVPAGSSATPYIPMNFGNFYRPAGANPNDFYVLVADDPSIEFSIQMTSNTILSPSVVGLNANLVLGAGSAYTGWSGVTLSNTTNTVQQQVTIVGFDPIENNNPSLAYAKVIVRSNYSTSFPGAVGV